MLSGVTKGLKDIYNILVEIRQLLRDIKDIQFRMFNERN